MVLCNIANKALNCNLEVVSYGNYDYVISVGFHVPTFNVFFNDFNMYVCNPNFFYSFVPVLSALITALLLHSR